MSNIMSDWKAAGARRAAMRNEKIEIRPPAVQHRNTKKWCRGKVGVEHKPRCVDYGELKRVTFAPGWKVLVCSACGKQLAHWWPSLFREPTSPQPDWVE